MPRYQSRRDNRHDPARHGLGQRILALELPAKNYLFLFADLQQIIGKPNGDFCLLVKDRIDQHKAKEAARLQAETERIERETRERLEREAREEARRITERQEAEAAERAETARRIAELAKCDLVTQMVGEFPELQGIMGGYYARHDGESDDVAFAIEDHYKPRFAGDALPRNHTGTVLALADKLETLIGLFGIGQLPTGDKDPFALRRHALGVIRILAEKQLPLDLPELLKAAAVPFGELITDPSAALLDFMLDRLAVNLREQGYSAQEVDAVLALKPARLAEVARRLAAVRAFAALPEAPALAAANKRVGNILKKAEGEVKAEVNPELLQEAAETALATALAEVAPVAETAWSQGDYTASLQLLAALKNPVDRFFDQVMVNADDPALKANRLGLLAQLHQAMNRVADLSRLAA